LAFAGFAAIDHTPVCVRPGQKRPKPEMLPNLFGFTSFIRPERSLGRANRLELESAYNRLICLPFLGVFRFAWFAICINEYD
jgi:hypothetical protein